MTSQFAVSKLISAVLGSSALLPLVSKGLVDKDWRSSLSERFGGGGWPEAVNCVGPGAAWFHAASVGEVGGLVPVIDALNARNLYSRRLITTTSITGRCEVLRRKIGSHSLLLPFDQPNITNKLVGKLRPSICVINETEIWPNLLFSLKSVGSRVVVINGRISDKSYPWYRRANYLLEPALDSVDFVLAQTELDANRFREIGVSEERVQVAGSTKYDRGRQCFSEDELADYAKELGLIAAKPILVGGSVRPEEDTMIIEAFKKIRLSAPEAQLIIAPRHPEAFDRVAGLLEQNNLMCNRRSRGTASTMAPVVLLDTVGELSKVYALASAAFVGGSIVDFGGHNPLEPAAYAKPVMMGPYSSNVREVAEDMERVGALFRVNNADDIAALGLKFCMEQTFGAEAGSAAEKIWHKHQGATDRVVSLLEHIASELPQLEDSLCANDVR